MDRKEFIEQVFEMAFGDEALYRGFTFDQVINKLREHTLKYEELNTVKLKLTAHCSEVDKGIPLKHFDYNMVPF